MILASLLDMNDFVHVDSLYLPCGASRTSPAVQSTSELLLAYEAPPIYMHPPPERTMRPPSPPPADSPLTQQGAIGNSFNVVQFLVDKSLFVLSKGEINIDQYGSNISEGTRHLCRNTKTQENPK